MKQTTATASYTKQQEHQKTFGWNISTYLITAEFILNFQNK